MASITKVKVTIGRTVNMGNFESLRASVSLEAHLNPEDEVTQVRKDLNVRVAQELDLVVQNMIKAYTK